MVSGGPAAASRIFVLKNAILTGQPVFQATLYLVEEDLARSGLAEDRAGQEVNLITLLSFHYSYMDR